MQTMHELYCHLRLLIHKHQIAFQLQCLKDLQELCVHFPIQANTELSLPRLFTLLASFQNECQLVQGIFSLLLLITSPAHIHFYFNFRQDSLSQDVINRSRSQYNVQPQVDLQIQNTARKEFEQFPAQIENSSPCIFFQQSQWQGWEYLLELGSSPIPNGRTLVSNVFRNIIMAAYSLKLPSKSTMHAEDQIELFAKCDAPIDIAHRNPLVHSKIWEFLQSSVHDSDKIEANQSTKQEEK
jgi:hypothetical protein